MISSTLTLIILYLIFRYIVAWIEYYNNTDDRFKNQYGDILMITLLLEKEIYRLR